MIQNRAARTIVSKINQFRTLNQFTFNETSENFQTAEIRGSRLDTRAFNAFIAKIPQRYRSVRFFVDFLTLEGEEFVTSSKQIVDLPDNYTGDDIIEKTSAISLLYNDDSKPVSSRAATIAGFHFQFDQLVGGKCESKSDVPAYLMKKKSIIKIYNTDNLCGQRALVLGTLHKDIVKRKNLCKPGRAKQLTKAAQVLAAQIEHIRTMSFADFQKFTDKFPEYSVWIWNTLNEANYSCGDGSQVIDLFYDSENSHYHLITNPDGLKRNSKVCQHCHKTYRADRGVHVCEDKAMCSHCHETFDCDEDLREHRMQHSKKRKLAKWTCGKCNQWGQSAQCSKAHANICKGEKWLCHTCHSSVQNKHDWGDGSFNYLSWSDCWIKPDCREEHERQHKENCGSCVSFYKCKNCKQMVPSDHRCFMQPKELKVIDDVDLGDDNIIVFDFEAFCVDKHMVNEAHWKNLKTNETGFFRGEHALRDFARMTHQCKRTTFIAHNGRGYDFILLSNAIHSEYGEYPKKITNGSKIMRMQVKSNVFIDSLSHIAGKLSSFPKTFNLGVKVRKGYYPYLFDTPETQGYKGAIPDAKYFVPDSMSTSERADFELWHLEQTVSNTLWDLQAERHAYCKNDVHILAEAMKVYIKTGLEETGINPMSVATIASFVMKTFRTNHLIENTVGVMTNALAPRHSAQGASKPTRTWLASCGRSSST